MRKSDKITARDLNRRAVIEEPTNSDDGSGGVTQSWSEVATVWCKVRVRPEGNSKESFREHAEKSNVKIEMIMRYRSDLKYSYRVKIESISYTDTTYYNVININDIDDRRKFLLLELEEI